MKKLSATFGTKSLLAAMNVIIWILCIYEF